MKRMKQNAGFTLVELVVVIAILGILAGVGTAGYSGYIKYAQKKADQTLVSNIVRAIETGTNSTMFVNDDSFTKGATTYPVGIITLTGDSADGTPGGCNVMASTTKRVTNTTECNMVEGTFYTIQSKQNNYTYEKRTKDGFWNDWTEWTSQTGVQVYYESTPTTVTYCTNHTVLPDSKKYDTLGTIQYSAGTLYKDTDIATFKTQEKLTVGNIYNLVKSDAVINLADCTGIYALATTGHGNGITTEELEDMRDSGVSRVTATTSGPLYGSITAAFGSTNNMKLQYNGWGKEEGDSHTYSTLLGYSDSLIQNIKDTADLVTGTLANLGSLGESYLSDDYEDAADMVNSFADFTVAKYPTKESWIPIWNAAADGGDSYAFGFPEDGKYHNDYVYAATKGYNAAFTSYCRANGMGGDEYEEYLTTIEGFSGPPNALEGIPIDLLPRMVNNAAFATKDSSNRNSLYAKFLEVSSTNGDAVFDQVAGLYSTYLSSGVCEKNGVSFYNTVATINQTGSDAYQSGSGANKSNDYFDYYNNYLQEMAAFYQVLENQEGNGIMIVVTVENGVVKCDVSPSSADLRNK